MPIYGSVSPGNNLSFRNILHNGDMRVAQRGTSSTGNSSAGFKTVDRWQISYGGGSSAGTFDVTLASDAPTGFKYSTKVQHKTSSTSPNEYVLRQFVEMQYAHCTFGKTLTYSFWYKSNRTGNHAYRFSHNSITGATTSNGTFTVNAADTWEYKTITITNMLLATTTDTADNEWGIHIDVGFLMMGTGISTVNANDYFNVTGIQLEIGSVATSFEHRPYSVELHICQRYLEITRVAGYSKGGHGNANTGCKYLVKKRTSPTITANGSGIWAYDGSSSTYNTLSWGDSGYAWGTNNEYATFYAYANQGHVWNYPVIVSAEL